MKRTIFILFSLAVPALLSAQKVFLLTGYGFGFCDYKSKELGVFFDSYTAYEKSLGYGFTQEFTNDIPLSHGTYWQLGGGIGGDAVQAIFTVEVIKTKTNPISARYVGGDGRDIWVNYRTSNSTIGVRFGNTAKFPVWGQVDLDIGLQFVTINSEYVYADGSKSMGVDHNLNGRFTDFAFASGLGLELGCKIYGPLNLVGSAHWVPSIGRQAQYHQFEDLQDWNTKLMRPDYLPRDMNEYISAPYNSVENSISNDFRGLRFTVGLQLALGNSNKDE